MKKCSINYFLCGNLQKNFSPHKARKKSGLGGCEMEDCHEGGHGSSSSYVSSNAYYFSSSLSESITISRITFLDST